MSDPAAPAAAPAAAAAATASPAKKRKGDDDAHPVLPADQEPAMYTNEKFSKPSFYPSPTGAILAYSIVYTSDPARAIAFYQALFGFEVKVKHGLWWTELACGTTSLALHWTGPPKEGAATTAPVKSSAEHGPGSSAPSFFVPELAAWHEKIKDTPHLTVIQPPKQQQWGGCQAVYADPDGLAFSVVEAPKASDFKH